jgi:hypothetical protein
MSVHGTTSKPADSAPQARSPHWYGIPIRVALLTFIGTLLSFSFSLLIGIILTAIVAASAHGHADMTVAYRRIALPSGLAGGFVVLCLSLVMEIRHYRQSKTLSAIERMN